MKFDFAIIGSGPAGSVISDVLSKKGFKVALIDRASNDKRQQANHFFCPYIEKSPDYYTPVFSNEMGGNGVLWHSKVYLLSKDEVENYNWFIGYDELKKYSDLLSRRFKISNSLITKINKKSKAIYRYSLRANFRSIYEYLKIKENKKIKVFKGYSPIRLNLKNDIAKSIIIKNINNKEEKIDINYDLIFCCGGLGNPHLLLNLLKKKNKNLGKFLSDHPHVNLGKIKISEILNFKKILKPNIKLNLKIKTDEAALIIKNKNYFCGIQVDYKTDPTRKLTRIFIRIKNLKLRIFLNFFSFFVKKINGLFYMLGFFFNRYYKYSFEFFFSQNPNSKNQIYLTNKFDKFGLKKAVIKWDLQKDDLKHYAELLNKSPKIGSISIKIKSFQDTFYKNGLSGLHPSCTTKIGLNDKVGVVNKDLKLFGYENIHVVGSSVFPYNGYTNPTWTIMTLALRLAKKLIKIRSIIR
tara:strand:+ start:1642 stop:3039 length:1398 start_codon:yes stop_codon:yes gene_type:complete